MRRAIDEMQQQIDRLVEKIRQVKIPLDEQLRAYHDLQQSLSLYETQYQQNIAGLEERHEALQQQLEACRTALVSALGSEEEDGVTSSTEAPISELQIEPEPFDPWDSPESEPLFSPPETPIQSEPDDIPITSDQQQKEKHQVQIHFARQLHPDLVVATGIDPQEAETMMKTVNLASDEGEDVADMLLRIPWHNTWATRGKNETLGDQWMRLITWQHLLEGAAERLAGKLATLKSSWQYANFTTWDKDGRKRTFFAETAAQIRKQNERLQQDLDACQEELAQLTIKAESEPDAGNRS